MAKGTLRLPMGDGLDRYTGVASVLPGAMSDMRNVRTLRGKVQARRGIILQATLPDVDDFDLWFGTGTFAADSALFLKGTNWQVAGGVADQTSPSASDFSRATQIIPGESYKVTWTVSGRTTGAIVAKLGDTAGASQTTNATFVETIVAGSSDSLLTFTADGTWDGAIDSVTISWVGTNSCGSVPLVHAVPSQNEAVAVGYYPNSRQLHVFRTGPAAQDPEHVDLWFTLDLNAADPPLASAATSYGEALIAHSEIRQGRRGATAIYNAIAATVTTLQADLRGSGLEDVAFRGVMSWSAYVVGWGFGDAGDTRPEIVRISLPGQPTVFDADHYFIAGDRGSAVNAVKRASSSLIVGKDDETLLIVGTSHLNFGILDLYTINGIIAPGLAVTVEGVCYAWGLRGPWMTTVNESGDLEPPLDLEGPVPADLPDLGALRQAFAVYMPRERLIQWHFGARVYALSIDPTEGRKWSYRESSLLFASGATVYVAGDALLDSSALAPTGHAELTIPVVSSGTTATVEWDNISQDGDEALEVYLKPDAGAYFPVVPGGLYGGTMVAADLDVSLDSTQTFPLTDLVIGLDYTVAVRYRRGGQYGIGYESSNPDDWPSTSRILFFPTPVAPVLDTAVWSRISGNVEQIRVDFTVATDHETVRHGVYRDALLVALVDAGVFFYEDTGISGETNEAYTIKALALGHESAPSNQLVEWAGPSPAHSVVEYINAVPGGCLPGDDPYDLSWVNGVPTLETQVLEDGALARTASAGATLESGVCADDAAPVLAVRHRLRTFGTDDYSDEITAVPE